MSLDNLTIAKRYSKALFELAEQHDQLDDLQSELNELRKVFQTVPNLGSMLSDALLSYDKKRPIVEQLEKDASPMVKNFIQMTFDYGRVNNIVGIINEFDNLVDEKHQIVRANLTTAVEITDDQKQQIADGFAQRIGAKKVVVDSKVDDSIIGGAVLESHGLIYDGSISTQINQIKQQLLS